MSEHPIEGLMKTAMNSIESLVDVKRFTLNQE